MTGTSIARLNALTTHIADPPEYPVLNVVERPQRATDWRPVGIGWLVLRLLNAGEQTPSSPIFVLRTEAQGNVVVDRTSWLCKCRGRAPGTSGPFPGEPYRGGALRRGEFFEWQSYQPPGGDRIVQAMVGSTYKSIWVPGRDAPALLGNAPQLLGMLDPQINHGHTVTPVAVDHDRHRMPATRVILPGAFLRFPLDPPPTGPDGHPVYPLVSSAFDMLGQLNEVRKELVGLPEAQASIAGAHLVVDYFDPGGWVLRGRYLSGGLLGSASDMVGIPHDGGRAHLVGGPHGILEPPPFERVDVAQALVAREAQRGNGVISRTINCVANLRRLFMPDDAGTTGTAAIQAFTNFVLEDPPNRSAWVMSFFAELADHLGEADAQGVDAGSATLRREILDGLTGQRENGPFAMLLHVLRPETTPRPAVAARSGGEEHRIRAPAGGWGETQSAGSQQPAADAGELGEEGGWLLRLAEAEHGDQAPIAYGWEILKSALGLWGEHRKLQLEHDLRNARHALGTATGAAESASDQLWLLGPLAHYLARTVPQSFSDLVKEGTHNFLDRVRDLARDHPDLRSRSVRLNDRVGRDAFLACLELDERKLEERHLASAAMAAGMARVKLVLGGIDLLRQTRAARSHFASNRSEAVDSARELASTLSGVLEDIIKVHETWARSETHWMQLPGAAHCTREGEWALGSALKWTGDALTVAAFGVRMYQVFWPPFHANQSLCRAVESDLDLISDATGVLAIVTPPPVDAFFTALGTALGGVKFFYKAFQDIYYPPVVAELEEVKRKLAKFTEYAREPAFSFPTVKVEGTRVVLHAAALGAPSVEALLRRTSSRWKLVLVLAYTKDEGGARLALPLANRDAFTTDLADDMSWRTWPADPDRYPYTAVRTLPLINFEPHYDARNREMSVQLPGNLVWLPQWGWGPPMGTFSESWQEKSARIQQLGQRAFSDDRPRAQSVQVYVFAVQKDTSSEGTAEKVWRYFYRDSDKAELVGKSEDDYPVHFDSGRASLGPGRPHPVNAAEDAHHR